MWVAIDTELSHTSGFITKHVFHMVQQVWSGSEVVPCSLGDQSVHAFQANPETCKLILYISSALMLT